MHVHAPTSGKTQQILKFSLVATAAYVVVLVVAGVRSHSLALLSEAGHNVSDLLALGLSFVAVYFQTRPATSTKTFGYQRAGVLAAFVNALSLIVLAVWIAVEAVKRLHSPVAVEPHLMMGVAAAGVVMNGVVAALLWRVSHDINIRSVFLHMLSDTLSTAAVIVGGFLILLTGQNWIDPVLSLIIAAMVMWSAVGIVRESLNILLEGTPNGMRLEEIRGAMQTVDGVLNVHDLHVWSLGTNSHALASHVTIDDIALSESAVILERINCTLKEKFRIHHSTIQLEFRGCETTHGCSSPMEEVEAPGHHHHGHGHHGHAH
jgi:cobalt-zinc-cadmium efflux system protein